MMQKRTRYTTGEKALTKNEWEKLQTVITNLEDEILFKLTISAGIRREDIGHSKKHNTGIRISDITELQNGTGKLKFFEHKKE